MKVRGPLKRGVWLESAGPYRTGRIYRVAPWIWSSQGTAAIVGGASSGHGPRDRRAPLPPRAARSPRSRAARSGSSRRRPRSARARSRWPATCATTALLRRVVDETVARARAARHRRQQRRRPAAGHVRRARPTRRGPEAFELSLQRRRAPDPARPSAPARRAAAGGSSTSRRGRCASRSPNLMLSNAIRPGVVGWAKTLAHELGPDGITVNTIAPGQDRHGPDARAVGGTTPTRRPPSAQTSRRCPPAGWARPTRSARRSRSCARPGRPTSRAPCCPSTAACCGASGSGRPGAVTRCSQGRTRTISAWTTCYRHPDRETGLPCSNCGRPICAECMTHAAVGIRCPECAGAAHRGAAGRRSRRPRRRRM